MANFYLDSPDGCNYNFRIYKYNSEGESELLAYGTNGSTGSYDLIRCHVNTQYIYEIKIYSAAGSSSDYYHFRVKNYTDRYSILMTADYDTSLGTTTPLSNSCKTEINNLGFSTVYDRYNLNASSVYSQIRSSDIYVILSENYSAGIIALAQSNSSNTYLTGTDHTTLNDYSYSISNYDSGDLSQTDLVIFAGSYTGATGSIYGNLVDQAVAKGAYCAIGWIGAIDLNDASTWLNYLFTNCQSRNMLAAMSVTDRAVADIVDDYSAITNRYYNSTDANGLYLDYRND